MSTFVGCDSSRFSLVVDINLLGSAYLPRTLSKRLPDHRDLASSVSISARRGVILWRPLVRLLTVQGRHPDNASR